MRRLALLVVVLATGTGVAISAEPGEPEGSQFIDSVDGSSFAFPSTTAGWTVEGLGKARVLRRDRGANLNASDPFDRQGLAVLWANKCTAKQQEIEFRRRVFVAGPEHKLGAAIDMVHAPSGRIKSARLLVNGIKVLSVGPAGGRFDRTADRPKVFRFGTNLIELVAVKAAARRKCNRSTAPGKVTGVRWNVFGEFAGDVALPEQGPTEEYRRLPEGTLGVGIPLDVEVRNNGPGGLARVPLNIRIEAPVTGEPNGTTLEVSPPDPQAPVRSCQATPPAGFAPPGPRFIACTIVNLRAGAVARQHVRLTFLMPLGSVRPQVYLRWSAFVEQPPGANGTDNERYKTIYLCKHDDASCPAPPNP